MIKTGLKELDQFLGGGIKEGLVTSISGQSATGKTQLTFQICLNALHSGKDILFQDTIGEFRPERLVEMMQLQKINPSLLDKIKVNRITNTAQQIQCFSKTSPKNYSLIIVDGITDLFSFEYSKKEQSLEKHISFMKYMHNLSSIAIDGKIPIIVTNIVRTINKHEKENLEESISMYTHTKIKLSKNDNGYLCQVISPFVNKKFRYTITSSGLTSVS
ncbi:recombinase RecA [Marine Group I thaumarchaeote]|jgi:DNA repair protein RAD51|uniref:Recombinase RecA n=1 Tax=Marine Group I thaumarchaeote TaxID=2511932 RepID=A0A7K4MXZ7_9ARCH|nr:recombinase RecA [Marine Group I thaumarchaeote]NWJ42653.1 recombinase RecA [Marine Group I thaumarchaeote]NWJ68045.1 recombinase RecA [Marine Group I thaumarchaeote]RZD35462.1 MAG: recombinase RecA [Nitrososphaerota archaeon]